jgi:4-hydroxybenzoate polyprenyltransferase
MELRLMLHDLIISMRPKQWYKNLVIFVCIIFSLNLLNFAMWFNLISAFAIFCLLSGSEYLINDILDKENDKRHPRKSKRPIASGRLKTSTASIFVIIFLILSFIGAILINIRFLLISASYFILMLSYSLFLKHLIIVDVLVISIGFVIRAIAGCLAISVFISPWLIICAFLIALFLALCKRRHELVLLGDGAIHHRKSLKSYSTEMLDQMINITTAVLIMSYSLYTFLADNNYLMVTIPFAIYGIFRYLFLVQAKNLGGEPEMLFKDKGMVISMGLWVLSIVLILYGAQEILLGLIGGF